MDLNEFIDDLEPESETVKKRRLADEKSYEIMQLVEDIEQEYTSVRNQSHVSGESPSIFVGGRNNYPNVSTGILSPITDIDEPENFATSSKWYNQGFNLENVLQRRTGLMDSRHQSDTNVHDVWDGFVGVQREVAIARDPVGVELGLGRTPALDFSVDEITSPKGPQVTATSAELTENPTVSRAVQKTLEDDDWKATGAMKYLYEKGFDVYDINQILSAGALGESDSRKLVPTRWSITAVDDTIGQHIRENITSNPSIDETRVYRNQYMGNNYWVIMTPGSWEFELVELKASGSVWNPQEDSTYMASAYEGFDGRTQYVDETSGAYYASRLGVLEQLDSMGRQAKVLVLREVTDEYWAPAGVWQVRESVRNAYDSEYGTAETFHKALSAVQTQLPVSGERLRRKSELAAGIQSSFDSFF